MYFSYKKLVNGPASYNDWDKNALERLLFYIWYDLEARDIPIRRCERGGKRKRNILQRAWKISIIFLKHNLFCPLLQNIANLIIYNTIKWKNKNVKALKIHSVILLIPLCLCAFCLAIPCTKLQLNVHFLSNSLNMHIFMISGPKSIGIDILFPDSRHFRFFQPSFWPKVDDVECWLTIPNLVILD